MVATYTPYIYDHPTLGPITGRLAKQTIVSPTAEVVQFRSLPFATIPARFKLAHGPLTSIPGDYDSRPHREFTQWGFACPQVPQDRLAGGGSLGEDDVRTYDEFACLNCTVTAPRKALEGEVKGLPVMVYLHGGAFVEGCGNISASHDTSRMVALSVEEGMPVIMVNLHYRLNWFGFFTCSDLLAEAQDAGDGFVADLGFRDQRLGFQWVQQQVSGFGGDSKNVTAFGESGGSISLTHHLCGTEPLFQRAILQSGTVPVQADDLKQRDEKYADLLKFLEIEEQSPEAKLKALRAAPVEKLVSAVNALQFNPAWPCASAEDPFYANGPPRWSTLSQQVADCEWCKEVIIGDTSFEGYMWTNMLIQHGQPEYFMKVLTSSLKLSDAESLCKYYNVSSDLPTNLFWTNASRMIGDFAFSAPGDLVLQGLEKSSKHKVYRYQVCLPNPFPGSIFSYVTGHHFVELMYLFLTYLERYPTHRGNFFANVAKEMARKWIGFANGREPWKQHTEETGYAIAIFDDLRGLDLRTREQDENISKDDVWGERRYEGWKLIGKALVNAEDGGEARGRILTPFI